MELFVFNNTFWKGGQSFFSLDLAFGGRDTDLSVTPLFWNVRLFFFSPTSFVYLFRLVSDWYLLCAFVVAFIVTQFRKSWIF